MTFVAHNLTFSVLFYELIVLLTLINLIILRPVIILKERRRKKKPLLFLWVPIKSISIGWWRGCNVFVGDSMISNRSEKFWFLSFFLPNCLILISHISEIISFVICIIYIFFGKNTHETHMSLRHKSHEILSRLRDTICLRLRGLVLGF